MDIKFLSNTRERVANRRQNESQLRRLTYKLYSVLCKNRHGILKLQDRLTQLLEEAERV